MNSSKSSSSFGQAWQIISQARVVFAILVIAAMIINLAIFFWVYFGTPVDALVDRRAVDVPSYHELTSAPASVEAEPVDLEILRKARTWSTVFTTAMQFSGVLAILGVTFMLFCALLGVMVLIAGNLPGTGAVTSAFFYALGAVLLLCLNWSEMLGEVLVFPEGIATFDRLLDSIRLDAMPETRWSFAVSVWIRYVLYPLIAVLITVMYLGRTGQAHAQMSAGTAADQARITE